MISTGLCGVCGRHGLLDALHGDKGGPLLCPACFGQERANISRNEKEKARIVDAFGFGRLSAAADELSRELLDDAVRLCHPDRHPPERGGLAERVTSELLSLRPFTKPRPAPRDASPMVQGQPLREAVTPAPRDASPLVPRVDNREPVTPAYPCDTCHHTVPMYYCDTCRARWDDDRQAARERDAAAQRAYRARKRQRRIVQCGQCKTAFRGRRKDARYCSQVCRQKAYRLTRARINS